MKSIKWPLIQMCLQEGIQSNEQNRGDGCKCEWVDGYGTVVEEIPQSELSIISFVIICHTPILFYGGAIWK
jgi:hypothetical protein